MLVVTIAAALQLTACSGSTPDSTDTGSPSAGATPEDSRADRSPEPPSEPATDQSPDRSPDCDSPCYSEPDTVGTLTDDTVAEVSGMAASVRTPGLYYVVSDEPGTAEVAVVQEDGTPVARLELAGMDTENAEALAVGPCGDDPDTSCLYVGDIGDHVGRDHVTVYRAPEPDLDDSPAGLDTDALEFDYEDGPTDAEALLVDPDGRPLVVSKATFDEDTGETGSTRLYRGPADGGEFALLGEIELPEPEDGFLAGLVGNVVTDASADLTAGRVLLRTYDEVLEYRAPEPGADVATFPDWPRRRVPAGSVLQAETVAYLVDDCGYLTTSELTGAVDAVRCTG